MAAVAALLPAAFFYAEYALADAIFPVLVLAWLLATHSWLTASSARGRYAAAVGSALLAGYAYAVHSRGDVIVLGYVAVGLLVAWRRLVPRGTVAAAALALAARPAPGWLLDRYLTSAIYPEGTRNLSAEMATRLRSVHGAINVFEMAAGQLWRLAIDSWGVAGIGLIAAAAVIARRGTRADVRIMAALAVAVTAGIACAAPAALPPGWSQTWASGRYLDGMIAVFFVVGAAVLLRARARTILACAACAAGLTVLTGVIVAVYVGSSLPTGGFANGSSFAEPAVLTQDWASASVWVATAAALGLLAAWVLLALAARRWPEAVLAVRVSVLMRVAGAVGIAAVSLVAVAQITSHVSQAAEPAQAAATTGFVAAGRVKPGDQIAVASNGPGQPVAANRCQLRAVGAAGVRGVVDGAGVLQPRPAAARRDQRRGDGLAGGQPAQASWPQAPTGWRIVASSRAGGWVVWRKA